MSYRHIHLSCQPIALFIHFSQFQWNDEYQSVFKWTSFSKRRDSIPPSLYLTHAHLMNNKCYSPKGKCCISQKIAIVVYQVYSFYCKRELVTCEWASFRCSISDCLLSTLHILWNHHEKQKKRWIMKKSPIKTSGERRKKADDKR